MTAVCITQKISADRELWDGPMLLTVKLFPSIIPCDHRESFFSTEVAASAKFRTSRKNMRCRLQRLRFDEWRSTLTQNQTRTACAASLFCRQASEPKVEAGIIHRDQFIIYRDWELCLFPFSTCVGEWKRMSASLVSSRHDDPRTSNPSWLHHLFCRFLFGGGARAQKILTPTALIIAACKAISCRRREKQK